MIERTLNNLIVRIIAGIVIGLPLTSASVVGGAHGIILGIGGITELNPLLLFIGLVTVTGFIGICGAWRRLLKPTTLMTNKNKSTIRLMLMFGLFSSLGLTVWSVYSEGITIIGWALFALSIGGVIFIYSIPKALTIRSSGTNNP